MWQTHYLVNPLVMVRLGLLALFVAWGARELLRHGDGLAWRGWGQRGD